MKTLSKIASALALVAALFACEKPVEQKPAEDFLKVEGLQSETVFTYESADPVTFTVEASKNWTIGKKNLDWLTVTPANGAANQKVTVTMTAQDNGETDREGTLEVYSGDKKETFKVKQLAKPIVPTVTVTGLENNAVAFDFNSTDPVKFKVNSNVAWSIEKTNLDWLTVDPTTGDLKKDVEITLTPSANTGAERSGTLTVKGEGAESVVITVTQGKLQAALDVKDLVDNAISFVAEPAEAVKFRINTNAAWTITASADWVSATPASGEASAADVEVAVTATKNEGEARQATLTIKSENADLQDVVITVSQEAAPVAEPEMTTLACFTLSDEVLQANETKYSDATWGELGIMHSDDGAATGKLYWFKNEPATLNPDPLVSSKQEGHYAVKWMWTGDYIEWSIPVKDFAAGSKVNVRFALSGKSKTPRYWNIEYYDNNVWKSTSTSNFMAGDNKDKSVTATFELPGTDVVYNVDETAVFSNAIPKEGNVKIRLYCVAGAYSTEDAGDQGFTEKGTNTLRIRQWNPEGTPAGVNDAILFSLVK